MAEPGYLFIEGSKQGKFDSDQTKGHKVVADGIPFLSFHAEVTSPRDAATGQTSGRRQWKAVQFSKAVDASSPMFWSAVTQNELIKKAEFRFFRIQKSAAMELYYQVVLEEATVSRVQMVQAVEGDASGTSVGAGLYAAREVIEIAFRKITFEHKLAKKMMSDDWHDNV